MEGPIKRHENSKLMSESVWKECKKGYANEEICNADETGLFYMTPDTFTFKDERCVSGKKLKSRLTVLISAYMSGTGKNRNWTISKASIFQKCKEASC
jgi:hypothetical protein